MTAHTNKLISLNGYWDFMPIYDKGQILELPENINYEKEPVIVPSSWRGTTKDGTCTLKKYPEYFPLDVFDYPKEWNNADCGILHRSFNVSDEDLKERIFLKFDAISQYSVIYLNGEKIAEWNELYLPLEIEVTDIVKEENELYVLCSSYEKVTIPSGQKKIVDLVGSWYGYVCRGIWQDCMVVVKPKCFIKDVKIDTSVRKNLLTVVVDTDNLTPDTDFTLALDIEDMDGSIVKTIEENIVLSGRNNTFELSQIWQNAIYWDCENPYLYNMTVNLKKGEEIVHTQKIRFGFREFWAEGHKFILNGVRVNLRGDSWHFQGASQMTKEYALNWCRLCKENGANSIRYHAEPHPEMYLDAADETGILIVDETAIYGSAKTMDASHPKYIDNCRKHIERLVERDKNHPSVVIWSLQNEMRWVDGRDEFKKFIPELKDLFHKFDIQGRLVSLDGDNRLISKEDTEIASLHYNIDGTINQWDKKVPLTIGEHGGLWYICPQNSSMYLGLGTYQNGDLCEEGISVKEQLFMEYARLKEVSGISSFNFAHYFAEAMPNEDIVYENWQEKEWGVNPKKIRKYSLTINNGNLPESYPYYKENPTCKYARDGMRPVTVICSEYTHSFYDDKKITKTLNVFNDTLKEHNARVLVKAVKDGEAFYTEEYAYKALPGEYHTKKVSFEPVKVDERTEFDFIVKIYHDNTLMYTYNKTFSLFPSALKDTPVTQNPCYYYGNEADFEKVSALAPDTVMISSLSELKNDRKILVVGSNIQTPSEAERKALTNYQNEGGNVILTEQFSFSSGEMTINKMDFLRAQASDYSHPVLKGISDNDLTYWNEEVFEEGPDPFIHSAFEKPVEGDYTIILECSYGDFNDGGDLWSPLMEYYHKNSTTIGCQLDVMKNFEKTPQACIIMRNMLSYISEKEDSKCYTAAFVTQKDRDFLNKLELEVVYDLYSDITDTVIVSGDLIKKNIDFLKKCKKVFVMSATKEHEEDIASLMDTKVEIFEKPVYELEADYFYNEVSCVSIVDLFGFDKPGMSPRETVNRHIAHNAIIAEGADTLIKNISGNHWEDLFANGYTAEYCKRAIVQYNRDNKEEPVPYYIRKDNTYVCMYDVDISYEKSIRVYTKLLSNLGCKFNTNKNEVIKNDAHYAIEKIMSLPYLEYQDYDRALEYYSDPEFSLNNLGEGLYGWMKKYERDRLDGYMKLHDTKNKTMFITCFIHNLKNPTDKSEASLKEYILNIDINSEYTLYINGEIITEDKVKLLPGNNRFFLLANVKDEELKFKAVFKNTDGTYADNLMYRVTVDEIDPK